MILIQKVSPRILNLESRRFGIQKVSLRILNLESRRCKSRRGIWIQKVSPRILNLESWIQESSLERSWIQKVSPRILNLESRKLCKVCKVLNIKCAYLVCRRPYKKKHGYPAQNTECLVCHVSAQECCDITPICARASQAPGLHPGYLRDIQCAYWFILHAYLFCYHP